ncbi:hypothetical protein QNI16_23510 [Cytophagaceae bacterium YF14B1]|uniref:Uncharacterized protein n=1 Tax=Xanthocytophaga flava TaxID=3048013 RepID=A0AAE3QRC0_9BACT|nr:hypothetical protein [Xanthocytophaga flavus]MDJ1483486.1 hypothetical protein [Xanthocytophaga flavus]
MHIQTADKEMYTITTEEFDIGQSTLARYNLFIKKKDEVAQY